MAITAAEGATIFLKGVSALTSRGARRRRKRARKALRGIQEIQNVQARRAFIQRFRTAQAEALLEGSREGGLRSSRAQGIQASVQTQGQVAQGEFAEQTRLGRVAGSASESAENLEGIADLTSAFGSAARAFI